MAVFDLVIYGATVAGILAAKAARSLGDWNVAIVEESNWKGGLVTGGLCLTDFGSKPHEWGYWKTALSQPVADYYGGAPGSDLGYSYRFEPKIMQATLASFIGSSPRLTFFHNAPLTEVETVEGRITRIIAGGNEFEASQFIDASYTGDLARLAGVTMAYGRESIGMFEETLGGIARATGVARSYAGVDAKGNRYKNIQPDFNRPDDIGDARIQGYNYRNIWSIKSDRLPWVAPKRPDGQPYRREDFLDVIHEVQSRNAQSIFSTTDWFFKREIDGLPGNSGADLPRPQANGKYGINQRDHYAFSWEYVHASPARRRWIEAEIYYRMSGTLYTVATDAALAGTAIQAEALSYGLCPDEFQGAGNYRGQPGWPIPLYVRETSRMMGQYIMTQQDFGRRGHVADSVSTCQYFIDKHTITHIDEGDGSSLKEGHRDGASYKFTSIPFRALKPCKGQADNLLVPVCLSSTTVMWQPLRMEPTWSMLGEVAGIAAHEAMSRAIDVGAVAYSQISPRLTARNAII